MFNSKGGEARRWSGAAVFVLGMVLLTLLPLSGSLQSQAGLAGYTIDPYSPGNWYTGIILQDMDCDGNPEVLAGNRNTSSVEIWKYNPGLRTLSLIDSIDFPYHVHDIKTADFDRDGDMDVVVGLRSYGLYYATNTGSPCTVGNWSSESIDSQYSWQVLVEDFDNDGELDIFDGVDYGPIHIFYGDGAGNFAQGNSVFDPDTDMRLPAGFNAVDLNGDGLLDLIGVDANYLRVFLNPGDRAGDWTSIGPTAPFAENDNAVRSILNPSAGDVDNDGYIDLAAYISVRPSGPFEVVLFKGGASGGNLVWEKQVLDTVDGEAEGQHAGIVDLNGDGNLDIHIGGATLFNNLLVYLGDGLGGFTPAHLVLDHGVGGMNSFVVRDLNGDGGLDIITTRSTSAQAQYGGFEILWAPVPTATLTLVKETDPDGGTGFPFTLIGEVGGWGSLGGEPGQFTTPMGVTVDNNGDVYVVDHHNARVQKFDKTGTFVLMQLPVVGYDVAVDASGNIFVTDPTSVSFGIKKYRSDGAYLAGADSFRSGGVAVDRVGNVYVANTFLSQIQKFDNNLVLLDTWGELGNGNGQFNLPGGIAVYDDGVNIIVYVADTGNGRIQKFDENGTYLGQWGSLSTGFSRPGAVEVDAAGNVYVADSGNGSIQKFDGDGNFLTSWYGVGASGVAINAEGHIYVTEPHRVRVFVDLATVLNDDQSEQFSLEVGRYDIREGRPDNWAVTDIDCDGGAPQVGVNKVTVQPKPGEAFTCTFTNTYKELPPSDPATLTLIKETDPDGGTGFPFTLVGEVGGWGSLGGEPGQFYTAMGVTVDNNGDVYVVDHHNARVQKFDKTGTFVLMQLPVVGYDVAVDASGNIFVTDPTSVSFGIKKYRSDGAYLAGADSFRSGGVAVDRAGNVYVANTFLSQIQKFDNNLVLLDTWGELGNGNGQFNLPGGIAVYDDGVNIIVYVADTGNGRIQKFDENGTYLGQWGSLSTGFSRPGAVEVDAAGNVYVADSGNGSIQKFDGDGNFLTSWYGVGADGIAVNTEGHIYVTEPHRVRVFVDQSATLDDDDSVPLALTPGVFDVSELVPDKWTLTDIICTGGDPQTGEDGVMLSLASNDDVTCTFTNTADPVSITVVKTVIGQPPATDWQYTGTLETFTLPAAGGERRFGSLDFGEYTITETAKPGYAQAVSCDNGETGEGSVTVSLQPGEAVVCTFTNTAQPGSITVIKEVVGQAPAGEWAYTGDLGEFNIPAAGGRQVFEPLDAGSYTINEAAKAAYSQSAACDTGETGTGSVTVDLAPGENVTCTFINTAQPGAITIIKEVVGQPPAADWAFTGDLDAFTLPAIGGASEPFTNLVAGDYTVTETAVAGYDQAVSCDSGESGTGSVTVSLQPGEAVICTFTNTAQPGSITIVKEVAGQLSAADWRFNLDQAGFTLPAAGGQTTFSRIPAGDHLLIEETVTGYDQSVTCDSGEKGVGSVIISLQPGETVVCTFTNTYVTVPPPSLRIFLSTTTSGMTADGVSFGSEDILLWDGHAWSNWFDGSAVGLEPLKARHNINAFSILDPEGDDLIFSFAQNRRHVPGIANPVDGMDLVRWDGSTFSVYFDGSDVGLTNKTQEKIDALHVIDTTLTPNNGENCVAYLLISTQGPGKIPNPAGGQIKFGGEDVLGFCATSLGENTTGQWEMVLDGSAEGMPRNATDSISLSDDGRMMYLTTQNTFLVDGAAGGHSMVYRYDFGTGEFSGPIFSAPANGLPAKVNGLQVTGILP